MISRLKLKNVSAPPLRACTELDEVELFEEYLL